MRPTSALIVLATVLTPFVAAKMHRAGVCVRSSTGPKVYHEDATKAACDAYKKRNTGDNQWDQCPDCHMEVVGNLNVCLSGDWHIGGDELNHYCKENGADGSMAN